MHLRIYLLLTSDHFSGSEFAFISISVFIFLYAMPILQASTELSFVFSTISLTQDAFTLHDSVHPFSVVNVAACRCILSLAMLTIIFPLSYVNSTSAPCKRAMAVLVSIHEVAYVLITVLERENALSCTLSFDIVSFIDISVAEHIYPTAMLFVI